MKKKIESEGTGDGKQDQVDMEAIQKDYLQNKETVVDLLVRNVLSVSIEIPRVVKGNF